MYIGFVVGIIISIIVLVIGIMGMIVAKKKGESSKWALYFIVFAICALISAVINSKILY